MLDSVIMNHVGGGGDVDESFLPRILSIFYAVFDHKQGTKIVYQVPEGSISVPSPPPAPVHTNSNSSVSSGASSLRSPSLTLTPSVSSERSFSLLPEPEPLSLDTSNSSSASASATPSNVSSPSATTLEHPFIEGRNVFGGSNLSLSRPLAVAQTNSTNATLNAPLVDFDSISEYVIPKNELYGRLVHCNTPKHRILGFPVVLQGEKFDRKHFRYNLCFVFDRMADLSCYEPIVRKCARVLSDCEEETGFLSNPATSGKMYQILEQLFEDLNSYSETSIRIDSFNTIELKIFPFYPNPRKVHDWQVPVALINLQKRTDPNWDLTMAKVAPLINGVNHIRKIADLADIDPLLTRHCVEHLLFYQCILMVDIFQYSNMYTLKPSIQWLAEDSSVQSECAPYVTRPNYSLAEWPTLLHLYSRLKPGKTLSDWIEENKVTEMGIDVRRFVSFGTIKGFLRRVHRWPILLTRERTAARTNSVRRKKPAPSLGPVLSADKIDALFGAAAGIGGGGGGGRGGHMNPMDSISASLESTSSMVTVQAYPASQQRQKYPQTLSQGFGRLIGGNQTGGSGADSASLYSPPSVAATPTLQTAHQFATPRGVRPRQGSVQSTLSAINTQYSTQPYLASTASISSGPYTGAGGGNPNAGVDGGSGGNNYHTSTFGPYGGGGTSSGFSGSWTSAVGPPTPTATQTRSRTTSLSRPGSGAPVREGSHGATGLPTMSTLGGSGMVGGSALPYPDELPGLLNGLHHTDELCTKFGVGWRELEGYLAAIGRPANAGPGTGAHYPSEREAADQDLEYLGRVKIIYR